MGCMLCYAVQDEANIPAQGTDQPGVSSGAAPGSDALPGEDCEEDIERKQGPEVPAAAPKHTGLQLSSLACMKETKCSGNGSSSKMRFPAEGRRKEGTTGSCDDQLICCNVEGAGDRASGNSGIQGRGLILCSS